MFAWAPEWHLIRIKHSYIQIHKQFTSNSKHKTSSSSSSSYYHYIAYIHIHNYTRIYWYIYIVVVDGWVLCICLAQRRKYCGLFCIRSNNNNKNEVNHKHSCYTHRHIDYFFIYFCITIISAQICARIESQCTRERQLAIISSYQSS